MNNDLGEALVKRFEGMQSNRSTWDSHWQEVNDYVIPKLDGFISKTLTKGEKKRELIYDGTAPLALERFASSLDGLITPRSQKWHQLKATNEDLNKSDDVQRWFEQVNNLLFRARYRPQTNFSSQQAEVYMSMGAFGTGALFIDEEVGLNLRYKNVPLANLYIQENHVGRVDTVFRKLVLTARQANLKFGDRAGSKVQNSLNAGKTEEEHEFIHCVFPNEEKDEKRKDFMGMDYRSYYVSLGERQIVSEGGYRTMPYIVSRYTQAPNETYGRSPAMTVLADIKMLNEMEKTQIRALHKEVDPPLLVHDDGVIRPFSTKPNSLNYGGVDSQGRQLIQPLQVGGRIDLNEQKMEQKRQQINEAFLVNLFQVLVEQPNMTATEVLQRSQEKGMLLSPLLGRMQSESLAPMIEREIDILVDNGALPEMPDELLEAQGEYEIEYDSPLSRAMRAEEAQGILRTVESVAPFAQIDPNVFDIFNTEEIVRILSEVNGVPLKALRNRDELAEIAEGRAVQAEQQQLLEATPVAANALQTVSNIQNAG